MPDNSLVTGFDIDTHSGYWNVGAEHMFGEKSHLGEMVADSIPGAMIKLHEASANVILSDNIILRIAVLLLFIAYIFIISGYFGHVVSLIGLSRGRSYVEKLLNDQNYVFERFVTASNFIGYLIIAVTVIKWVDIKWGSDVVDGLPSWVSLLSVGIVWGILVLVAFFQKITMKLTGSLVQKDKFTEKIIYFRRLSIALLAVVTAPFVLMLALAPPQTAKILLIVVFAEYCILALFFLFRSYMLFIEQKISIFYWILYLCAVEIFPLTVPLAIILRNIG